MVGTPAGQLLALRLTRRHRLVVSFLAETLDVSVDRISVEVDRLVHHVSPELEKLIAARFEEPTADLDGDAPPAADADRSSRPV